MPKETFFNLPEEKRQNLQNIAIDEFADNAYSAVSVSRIVARAKIAKGSFYQYFEDKRDLYLHLLEMMQQEKMTYFGKNPPPDPESTGVFETLRWLATVGTGFEMSNPKLSAVSYRAFFGDSPIDEEERERISAAGDSYYRQLLETGIAAGDIRDDIDPELAVFVLTTIMRYLGEYMVKRSDMSDEELQVDGAFQKKMPDIRYVFDGVLDILQYGMGTGRPDEGGDSTDG